MTRITGKISQYALVAFLIDRAAQADRPLDKRSLQKQVHLIQELASVDMDYRFAFHTHGPYCADLAGDLDLIAHSGGAKIRYVSSDNRYLIEPGECTGWMIEKGQAFLDGNRATIDRVLAAFDGLPAKSLELASSFAYLYRHAPWEEFEHDGKLVKHVKELKPRYSETEIVEAIAEVRGFLSNQKDGKNPARKHSSSQGSRHPGKSTAEPIRR